MILEVDDDLPGREKIKQLKIQMVTYAYKKKKYRQKVADFLGYSPRWVQYTLHKIDELAHLRSNNIYLKDEDGYQEMMRRYPSK